MSDKNISVFQTTKTNKINFSQQSNLTQESSSEFSNSWALFDFANVNLKNCLYKGEHVVQDFAVRCTKQKMRFEKFIKGTETTHWFARYGFLVENDVIYMNAVLLWTHGKQVWLWAFFNWVQVLLYVSPGQKINNN